jgi:hypothetical protein
MFYYYYFLRAIFLHFIWNLKTCITFTLLSSVQIPILQNPELLSFSTQNPDQIISNFKTCELSLHILSTQSITIKPELPFSLHQLFNLTNYTVFFDQIHFKTIFTCTLTSQEELPEFSFLYKTLKK